MKIYRRVIPGICTYVLSTLPEENFIPWRYFSCTCMPSSISGQLRLARRDSRAGGNLATTEIKQRPVLSANRVPGSESLDDFPSGQLGSNMAESMGVVRSVRLGRNSNRISVMNWSKGKCTCFVLIADMSLPKINLMI